MWDADDTKRVKTQVVGAILIIFITAVAPFILSLIMSANAGNEALKRVNELYPKVDSLEQCSKKIETRQSIFEHETAQDVQEIKNGIIELKTGQTNIYNLLIGKQR